MPEGAGICAPENDERTGEKQQWSPFAKMVLDMAEKDDSFRDWVLEVLRPYCEK